MLRYENLSDALSSSKYIDKTVAKSKKRYRMAYRICARYVGGRW